VHAINLYSKKNEILYELYSSAVSIQPHKAVLTVKNTRGLVN